MEVVFENYEILIAETDRHRGVFAALPCCAEKRRHTDTAADEQIVRVRVERKAVAEGRQNIHLIADLKLISLHNYGISVVISVFKHYSYKVIVPYI